MLERASDLAPAFDVPIRFLKLVLPGRGYYIAAIKRPRDKGFKPSIFATTLAELWTQIENHDRDGYEVYFACGSYKEARNDPPGTPVGQKRFGRTKHNVLSAQAFWLDIDAGPEKIYPSLIEAQDALAIFCRTLKLPLPICVSSGMGLHAYWPLQVPLEPATWGHYASGLKTLCYHHKLDADPVRTADISSVLRVPGTHNHKRSKPQLVKCEPAFLDIQPYAIEPFEVFADTAGSQRPRGPLFLLDGIPSAHPQHHRDMTERALAGLATHPPSFGEEIVNHCGQLRKFRDERGNISEPLWYAALGVLAFCEDGDAHAHEWSNGYADYTEQETQDRLDRLRTLTGATTCEKFRSLNPEGCAGCEHWPKINSPIRLGRRPEAGLRLIERRVADSASREEAMQNSPGWELTQGGALKPKSYVNAGVALNRLGIEFRHDVFHNRKLVRGEGVENHGPELSDAHCRALRDLVIARYRVDCGIENIQQAAERACEANPFDPLRDYLDSLLWDGIPRLDRWMVVYLGAEDTPLNRSIGRKMLIAAVRRARRPGCKFDYVVVLEGGQGTGKSSALRILAGEDNFSDQPILQLETRAQQEAVQGVWIYELGELVGLRRTEVETVKGFISRQEDNARPAYGRFRVDQPRRCIFVGTTNDNEYLRDSTGNRRFWPVRTSAIALEALQDDRDKLWAETARAEAQDDTLVIPENLYITAANQQDQRLVKDPWEDILAGVNGKIYNDGIKAEERISFLELLTAHLRLPADKSSDVAAKRLRNAMNRLGWQGPKRMRFETEVWEGAGGRGGGKKSTVAQGYWRIPCSG